MGKEEYVKGKITELRLGKILLKHGYFVIRSPASGRRAKHFIYPDLVAIKQGKVLLIEVKLRQKKDTVYIPVKKYQNYIYASKLTGGDPYLAIYVKSEGKWYMVHFNKLINRGDKYVFTTYMYDKAEELEKVIATDQ